MQTGLASFSGQAFGRSNPSLGCDVSETVLLHLHLAPHSTKACPYRLDPFKTSPATSIPPRDGVQTNWLCTEVH